MADKDAHRLFNDVQAPNPFHILARSLRRNPQAAHSHAPGASDRPTAFVSSNRPSSTLVFFPWNKHSLDSQLWDGALASDDWQTLWQPIARNYRSVFAVANARTVRVYRTTPKEPLKHLFAIALNAVPAPPQPEALTNDSSTGSAAPREGDASKNKHDDDILALTWALDPNELHPLLVIAASRVLHIFDVVRQCPHGVIKGHGGDITSLATHPAYPQFICSTSRDCSTRFYDLQRHARFAIRDPERPPRGNDHYGGPAFGMQARAPGIDDPSELPIDVEGFGCGKCIGVLWGPLTGAEYLSDGRIQRTRYGGHSMAVYNADFHPSRNFLATCGLDHCIKIWPVPQLSTPPEKDLMFYRSQIPVFSSSAIHNSRVISVRWIDYDLLLSESVHETVGDGDDERHRFVIWQWLSMERYSEIDEDGRTVQPHYKDFTESVSYKIISVHDVPMPRTAKSHVHYPYPGYPGSPLLFVPTRGALRVYNLKLFSPVPQPPFPHSVVEAREWYSVDEQDTVDTLEKALKAQEKQRYAPRPEPHKPWMLEVKDDAHPLQDNCADLDIGCCAFTPDRRRVVAASLSGDVYVWDRRKDE